MDEMTMHPIAKGTLIEKVNSEQNDGHCNGSRGTVVDVLGPYDVSGFPNSRYGYWILWDDFPLPVFTLSQKVKPVDQRLHN